MPIHSSIPVSQWSTGHFCVGWNSDAKGGGQLTVSVDGRPVWQSVPGHPFIEASEGQSDVQESRGFFRIKDSRAPFTTEQHIDSISESDNVVSLSGWLDGTRRFQWQLTFAALDEVQLQMVISIEDHFSKEPRLRLRCLSHPNEQIFGFGEQFTHVNLKGKHLEILSQEPGIGRGVQPLTWFMNTFFGAGGDDTRSNAPVPHYITSRCQSVCLENHELSRFDIRQPDQINIELWASSLRARIFNGRTPVDLIEAYTRFCGRMQPLPEWIQSGAIIGMQGGTKAVQERAQQLAQANVPIAAYWLQDWVGARKTSVGSQLWWNWELDSERYPRWDALRDELAAQGIRLMSYINPFLVDISERDGSFQRNLYKEADEQGFLVQQSDGTPYLVQNTSFAAAMIDLTHPEARAWLKKIITEQVLKIGVSGWMADFGEALPFDAVLHDGSDPARFHNAYPEEWAKLNREVIEEAGMMGEVAFFARSGFTRSPGLGTLFWLGDQLTSWRAEDGIRSAVTGLLSSGFSGYAQNHSDIGGYTTTAIPGFPLPIPFLDFRRSRELLQRWFELNAFTAVFRTHEGNQPKRNYQIDGDPETIRLFARFARLYAALAPLRIELGREAANSGLPVVRHPWVHFPEDPNTCLLQWQFMLGNCLMVAPVLDSNQTHVSIYLPAGKWQHLWSDRIIEMSVGGWLQVHAPIGSPAVFFRDGDSHGRQLVAKMDDNGDRQHWNGSPWNTTQPMAK